MVRTRAVAAATLAALLACAAALPQREQEVDRILSKMGGAHAPDSRYDANGHKVRNLDALGGGHLVRGVREAHRPDFSVPYISGRHYDYFGPYAGKRELLRPSYRDFGSYYNDVPKRTSNFDEIDRTSIDSFVKRNFDEIDRTTLDTFFKRAPLADTDLYPLPYALRFYDH